MNKNAIFSIDYHSIQMPLNFKQLVLLFDKIIIEEQSLGLARSFVNIATGLGEIAVNNYNFNNQNIDFLGNAGLLEFESINKKSINVKIGSPDAQYMSNAVKEWQDLNISLANLKIAQNKGPVLIDLMTRIKQLPVSLARSISIRLNNEGIEAYPIYNQTPNYSSAGKKEEIIKFALSQIPYPDDSVSWEQIIDFRSDTNTIKKYYGLIKWVNDISKKDLKLTEVEDEYNYLYHEYAEQYRIHKMKSQQGKIEILVTAAIDTLSGNLGLGMIRTSLFSAWKNNINLLESESKMSGREIAYIFKAQQTFIDSQE